MKRNHALVLAEIIIGLNVCTLAEAAQPSSSHVPGRHAKATRAYRYVYYPAHQVYYAPDKQVWFWMSGTAWRSGVQLPATYDIQSSVGMPVMLHGDRPYAEHTFVEQRYGRPWRKQHQEDKTPIATN